MNRDRVASRIYWLSVVCWTLLGLALRWEALEGTFLCDDWDHYAMYEGIYPASRGALDMFNFVDDVDGERAALRDTGRLPWWSSSDLQLAVFRPLSSALLYFDYAVLKAEGQPWRAHLHSMLWWVALVAGTSLLFRQLLPTSMASIAVLLYAVDDAHTLPVLWIANRSELVGAALMVWGMCAYVAYRTHPARGYMRFIAVGIMACGLYAGEYALGLLAYVFAFELMRTSEPLLRRVSALVPFALLALLYLVPRQILGYAVKGSTFYVDPISEPGRFIGAFARRMPILLADLALGYPADWQNWTPPPLAETFPDFDLLPVDWQAERSVQLFQLWIGVATAMAVVLVLYRFGRRHATGLEQVLRWLLLGAVLSLVPLCGTMPTTRLTVGAAIGFSALLAACLHWLWESLRMPGSSRRMVAGLAGVAILVVHGGLAAQRTFVETRFHTERSHADRAWALRAELDERRVEHQHVMIVSGPDWASQLALPYILHQGKHVLPKSSEVLSPAPANAASITRLGPNAIDLHTAYNPRAAFDRAGYRRVEMGFRIDEKFSLGRYTAVIIATQAGEPTIVRFFFPNNVEDQRYVFLHSYSDGLKRFPMPKVGETVELPQPAWPSAAD